MVHIFIKKSLSINSACVYPAVPRSSISNTSWQSTLNPEVRKQLEKATKNLAHSVAFSKSLTLVSAFCLQNRHSKPPQIHIESIKRKQTQQSIYTINVLCTQTKVYSRQCMLSPSLLWIQCQVLITSVKLKNQRPRLNNW